MGSISSKIFQNFSMALAICYTECSSVYLTIAEKIMLHIYRIFQTVVRQAITSKLDNNSYFAHSSAGSRGVKIFFSRKLLKLLKRTPFCTFEPHINKSWTRSRPGTQNQNCTPKVFMFFFCIFYFRLANAMYSLRF